MSLSLSLEASSMTAPPSNGTSPSAPPLATGAGGTGGGGASGGGAASPSSSGTPLGLTPAQQQQQQSQRELEEYLSEIAWKDERTADITLEINGQRFQLHKILLARSPYFRLTFSTRWDHQGPSSSSSASASSSVSASSSQGGNVSVAQSPYYAAV